MLIFFVVLLTLLVFSVFYVRGIDNMMKEHSDYKGEDFLQ